MNEVVIDTNVLRVAAKQHHDTSNDCITACAEKLRWAQTDGVVVIDDGYKILGEYLNSPAMHEKTAGGAFSKWLLQNQKNSTRVNQVAITETSPDHFAEFPDQALQPSFDTPDRKFPAVANSHPSKPPVVQAVDCKWLNWWPALLAGGVTVDFICPSDACRFYMNKFPATPVPALP